MTTEANIISTYLVLFNNSFFKEIFHFFFMWVHIPSTFLYMLDEYPAN